MPLLPETGHRERGVVLPLDPIGLLPAVIQLLPIVEAGGQDETGSALPSILERALLMGGFRTRIDEPVIDVISSGVKQAPGVLVNLTVASFAMTSIG